MTLYNVVDTFFAGKISPNALAALAQTLPVYFIIMALGVGLSIETTSLMANALGEKDNQRASYYFAQSMLAVGWRKRQDNTYILESLEIRRIVHFHVFTRVILGCNTNTIFISLSTPNMMI